MTVNHDIDFYIRTDRHAVIETTAATPSLSLTDLLLIPDIYVKYFLLTNLDFPAIEGSREILGQLKGFFRDFIRSNPIIKVDFSEKMSELIRKKITLITMEDFVACISELDFSSIDLEYYRKFFGYSQIYSLYKSMIRRVFGCNLGHREVGLVILLLDNETLCFKKLLPIFSRLTTYVKSNIIDKNIVACCIVLRSTLIYMPNVMNGKDEYIVSLISYFSGITSQRSSFAFINEKDADEILSTLEALTHYNFIVDVGRVSMGILKETVFNLEILIRSRTSIYEEVFSLICMLEVASLVYELLKKFGNLEQDFSEAYAMIQGACVPEMDYIGEEEWIHINDKFLVAKYRSLNSLYTEGRGLFDRVTFYNDVSSARHPSGILEVIGNLKSEILWSDIIVLACSSKNQGEYLRFVFDDYFLAKTEHLVYIGLFIDAISDDPELLLYSGYLLLKSATSLEVERGWEILADLYIKNIQSEDQRLIRLRCIISDYINSLESLEHRSMFLKKLIDKLRDNFVFFNPSVISFLHLTLRKNGSISPEMSEAICSYLIECLSSEFRNGDESSNFFDLETVYVSVAAEALILSGDQAPCVQEKPPEGVYYGLIISCLAWIKGELSQEYFLTVKDRMFEFLFEAKKSQIDELGLLIKKKPSRFVVKFEELYQDSEQRCELSSEES